MPSVPLIKDRGGNYQLIYRFPYDGVTCSQNRNEVGSVDYMHIALSRPHFVGPIVWKANIPLDENLKIKSKRGEGGGSLFARDSTSFFLSLKHLKGRVHDIARLHESVVSDTAF